MNNNITLLIALGTAATLFLAISIVLFVVFYQRRMLKEQLHRQELEKSIQEQILRATLESQEAERKNVAGDLHDSIGGMLSAIRVGIAGLARLLPDPQKMEPSKQMLDDAIESVRRISRDLMPSTLEKFGLAAAIRELIERLQTTTQIQMSVLEIGEAKKLDKKKELMIFRIAQELVNNAIKHAGATYIELVMQYGEQLTLSVEDNGVGLSPAQLSESGTKSLGLFNIQSRVQLLRATLTIDSNRTEGSKIMVVIPYAES